MKGPFLLLGLAAALGLFPSPARAEESPERVAQAIALRRARVAEFQVIKEAAEELGMRVWLFGGTAAGYAHYVRWDLAREAGDERYQETFFDYDFTNIYRSTQDADLVVDSTPQAAEELESLIKEKLTFLQGSKDHWEVRLLRQDRTAPGGQVKQALLNNPDFLGQSTDSNSTGMIELTDPPPGERVVRDLRDWQASVPFFLTDITEGRLHYYRSATHRQTSRYRSGDNPEIFSVIRFLVKAFQYDLAVEGEDLREVQALIDDFQPQRDYAGLSPWAKGWLERYGPNLIRHSVNIEHAWNTLEGLGLRQKLVSLSDPAQEGSLGWWLSREPLRTQPVGRGNGRTAAQLGIAVVAHETSDFLAYESITRDTTLRPNVLVSRQGAVGELAAFGVGFYTQQGRTGARGTGLTIRFRVDPAAREGADFTVHGDYVLFTNRAALTVIPESLNVTSMQYFEMLRDGVAGDPADRGIRIKLKRRLAIKPLAPEEEAEVHRIVSGAVQRLSPWKPGPMPRSRPLGQLPLIVSEWLTLPTACRYPELAIALVDLGYAFQVASYLDRPCWSAHPEVIERILPRAREAVRDWPEAGKMFGTDRLQQVAWTLETWFKLPVSTEYPELLEELIDQNESEPLSMVWRILCGRTWQRRPEVLLRYIRQKGCGSAGSALPSMIDHLLQVVDKGSWSRLPALRERCGGRIASCDCLLESLETEEARTTASRVVDSVPSLNAEAQPGAECP